MLHSSRRLNHSKTLRKIFGIGFIGRTNSAMVQNVLVTELDLELLILGPNNEWTVLCNIFQHLADGRQLEKVWKILTESGLCGCTAFTACTIKLYLRQWFIGANFKLYCPRKLQQRGFVFKGIVPQFVLWIKSHILYSNGPQQGAENWRRKKTVEKIQTSSN